jgi:HIRAN domain
MSLRRVVEPKPKVRWAPTATRRERVASENVLTMSVSGIKKGGYDISHCLEGDPVRLVPEPDNAFDPKAIKVMSGCGEMLGYVPADYAVVLDASEWSATVSAVLPHPATGAPAGLRLALRRCVETMAKGMM